MPVLWAVEAHPRGTLTIVDVVQFTEGPFIERSLGPTLMEVLAEYPAVMLVGPRQAGKTTLLIAPFGRSVQLRFARQSGNAEACYERPTGIPCGSC